VNSLASGTRIGGYRIVRTLSEVGHFSIVYCAVPLRGGGEVALKENYPAGAADRSRSGGALRIRDRELFAWALERFEREAEFLRRHRHPNLVHILEPPIRANDTSYMAMEYLTGGSLRRRVERGGPQDEAQVRVWLIPLLSALESIESVGTSHLDLSPDNIMFRATGDPVLVDFGSARIGGTAPMRRTRVITNSGYSAPEKLSRTSRDIDARADVYSLAALVNFAMTGLEPGPAQDRLAGRPALPPRIAARRRGSAAFLAAVDKGFALAVAERHRGARAFADALAVPDPADPSEVGTRPPAARRDDAGEARRRMAALVLAFALLLITILLLILLA
jgi:serine/threonine protein kinase